VRHGVPGQDSAHARHRLIIEIAGDRFAIPQLAVLELVRVRNRSQLCIERIKDSAVLRLRNKLLPLVDLKALLGMGGAQEGATEGGFIVVMQVGSQAFGLLVDGVFDTEEIVVKPMSSRLRQIALFCGNTILGDGSVILILDPNGIAHAIGVPQTTRRSQHQDRGPRSEETPTESMLVFRAGSPNPKAVPLSLVTRLEEIDTRTIELSNGRPIVQYRGQLMPLVPATGDVQIKSGGTQPLLVFSDDRRSMGLIVDEIIDIVEDRLEIGLASENPGILGSAVIKGQATEVIDIAHFLPIAFANWRHWKERAAGEAIRRVLLIDDAPFFRNMLAPVVKAAGYSVTTVASAGEALAVLESGQRFDFVLTDIEMPGMNGFDLASALRFERDSQGGASNSRRPGVPNRGSRGWRASARGLSSSNARCRAARLEHAQDGRVRVPVRASSPAGRRSPESGVLHQRE
jgi:two-component system chemotaxis sensor kinase CheA